MENPELFRTNSTHDGQLYHLTDITLRDIFAGIAMQAFITRDLLIAKTFTPEAASYNAYVIADAMLAERQKGTRNENN